MIHRTLRKHNFTAILTEFILVSSLLLTISSHCKRNVQTSDASVSEKKSTQALTFKVQKKLTSPSGKLVAERALALAEGVERLSSPFDVVGCRLQIIQVESKAVLKEYFLEANGTLCGMTFWDGVDGWIDDSTLWTLNHHPGAAEPQTSGYQFDWGSGKEEFIAWVSTAPHAFPAEALGHHSGYEYLLIHDRKLNQAYLYASREKKQMGMQEWFIRGPGDPVLNAGEISLIGAIPIASGQYASLDMDYEHIIVTIGDGHYCVRPGDPAFLDGCSSANSPE